MIKLALVLRDVLLRAESFIKIGRSNLLLNDFTSLHIVVDVLSPAVPLARGQAYDGTKEELTRDIQFQAPCIVSFYGNGAMAEAVKFSLLIGSESGMDAQIAHKVSVFGVSGITNVKLLTGEQYSERVEISLNCVYSESIVIPTLRIDEAQNTFLTD